MARTRVFRASPLAHGTMAAGWIGGAMASAQRRVRERERYAGEWAKDVRAGTGVLTDAHGKAWDV